MRRILLATLIAALGLAVGAQPAHAASSSAQLSLGDYCSDSQAIVNINLYDASVGEEFDILIDSVVVADNVGPGLLGSYPVTDGVHTIVLQLASGEVLQTVRYGASCGVPAIEVTAVCSRAGALHVISNQSAGTDSYDLYLDGYLHTANIGNTGWGNDFGPLPDGSYMVEVKVRGAHSDNLIGRFTIDCVDGNGGEPATIVARGVCDGDGWLEVEMTSFTYGQRFTVWVDGTAALTDVYGNSYSLPATSGSHHVVVTDNNGDTLFDDTLLVACEGPVVAAKATCVDGSVQLSLKTADPGSWVYTVSVDETPLPAWQDAAGTNGQWVSLGTFTAAPHHVLVSWTTIASPSFSQEFVLSDACTDSGSGAGGPVVGSDTAPMLFTAGLLVLVGLGLVSLRRPSFNR